jgi:anhydro-N-acetylmuramic acid kinase
MRAIGLMSGTSMDGIDVALIETDGETAVARGPSAEYSYDAAFRRRIAAVLEEAKQISKRDERPGGLFALEKEITERHADAVLRFMLENGIATDGLYVIGFHGQTVLHRPHSGLTVQLGDGNLLAAKTGIPVIYDMRANDMARGGQGAPLVPVYHAALAAGLDPAQHRGKPVCFVNIGGISNITYVRQDQPPLAFDTGPGNALIDQWVERHAGIPFDDGGRIAAEGGIHAELVDAYLADPFFKQKPPKSLDRNDFDLDLVEGLELSDGARTLARVTAEAIMAAASHFPAKPGLWIICGGGRKNSAIMSDLADLAAHQAARVVSAEECGLNGGSMEAEAWAYLAVRSLKGLPLTFPETTGVREAVTGGVLARPESGLK